jgi:hypothetical protein
MCVTTSIFPSPTDLMSTLSPRLPVRPSTLMRSCRNFSKAPRSKILSETGWLQLMVYWKESGQLHYIVLKGGDRFLLDPGSMRTLFVTFAPLAAFPPLEPVLAYIPQKPRS